MKRKVITTTEEFDAVGNLKTRITEETEEIDNGYIYPQTFYGAQQGGGSYRDQGGSGDSRPNIERTTKLEKEEPPESWVRG